MKTKMKNEQMKTKNGNEKMKKNEHERVHIKTLHLSAVLK